MDNDFVTPSQAATLCHVSTRTIRTWLHKGHITKHLTPNGYNVVISQNELLAYDRERRESRLQTTQE